MGSSIRSARRGKAAAHSDVGPEPATPITGAQGLDRALQVLLQIADSPPPGLSLAACASILGHSKPTTHRVLRTLERRGFVHHDPDRGLYSLGVATIRLGAIYLRRLDLRQAAAAPMRALVDETEETAHLGTLNGPDVVYVEVVDSPQPVRIFSQVGDSVPAYATAIGKAVLAWTPESALDDHLPTTFVARTERTVMSMEELTRDLAQTRGRGYAIDDRENRELIRAFAAPVFDHEGGVVAAVSIAGPADRVELGERPPLAQRVVNTAERISTVLGAPRRESAVRR